MAHQAPLFYESIHDAIPQFMLVEHELTGLTFSLCGDHAALKSPSTGSFFPAARAGRLSACTRIVTLLQPEAGYEVVRRDA